MDQLNLVSKGRVALITGASRGIGRAITEQLLAEHFDVTISARNPATLENAAITYRESGRKVVVVPADMSLENDVERLAHSHLEKYERLDLLVLCAGIGSAGELGGFPARKFDKQMTVNVRSPFLLVQHLLPLLRATAAMEPETGSKVVALSSIIGVIAEPDLAAYGASKAALISLCESITVSEANSGVIATAISPGFVDTDMSDWVHERIDPEKMIRPKDIATLVSAISRLSRYAAVPNIVVSRPGAPLWRA